jgi:outer membrane protein assembly factor BamA
MAPFSQPPALHSDRTSLIGGLMPGTQPRLLCFRTVAVLLLLAAPRLAAQQPADTSERTVPQRDVFDILYQILGKPVSNDTLVPLPPGKAVFTILPVIAVDPATGLRLGAALDGLIRLGPIETTKLSRLGISASYGTTGQFNLTVPTTIWFRTSKVGLQGDWRYLDMNQNTYGLGALKPDSLADNLSFQLLRFYETGYFDISKDLYAGLGYHLDHYFAISDPNSVTGPSAFKDYNGGVDISQTTSSGITLSLLFESRDTPVNPKKGYLIQADLQLFPTWMGSDDDWQAYRLEFRAYPWLDRRGHTILATQFWAWTTVGHTPYMELPALGWDKDGRTGRGYVQGQIRSSSIWYAEAELRQQLTRNDLLGGVAFVNLTSAAEEGGGRLGSPNPGYGIGLRFKYNKKIGANITADLAFDSKGRPRFYLSTGEVF